MRKLYECYFIDEFSQEEMIICDLPTNDPIEITNIINSYGLNSGFKFMAVINGIVKIKNQKDFKNLPPNSKIIKYYHI